MPAEKPEMQFLKLHYGGVPLMGVNEDLKEPDETPKMYMGVNRRREKVTFEREKRMNDPKFSTSNLRVTHELILPEGVIFANPSTNMFGKKTGAFRR